MDERILLSARFDERLKTYWLAGGVIGMAMTVVGIPLIPFWVWGPGRALRERRFARLQADLTDRALKLRRGYLFRVEKTIPLDKITDLALHDGPILRWLGLCTIAVETAGHSAAAGADAHLAGVVDAMAFRDAVLRERERVTGVDGGAPRALLGGPPDAAPQPVLVEIRDSLLRIERLLTERERP
jgi:putative membrane protein